MNATRLVPTDWCDPCREHVFPDHECPNGAACPTPEGNPCGVCGTCIAAQADSLGIDLGEAS